MSNHLSVDWRAFYILAMRERWAEFTRGKWQPFRNEPTVCFMRQMGRGSMMRDHFGRLMEDAGRSGGSGDPFLKERRIELEELRNAWETRRDG